MAPDCKEHELVRRASKHAVEICLDQKRYEDQYMEEIDAFLEYVVSDISVRCPPFH